MRNFEIKRKTNETDIKLALELDGQGEYSVSTGCAFLDHMLCLFARHGKFNLTVECNGAVVTILLPFLIFAPPNMAMLSLSVPPEVKYTSSGVTPSAFATSLREEVTIFSASSPSACLLDGLPKLVFI